MSIGMSGEGWHSNVYVSFNVLPLIGFGDDFAIESGCGMRHLESFLVFLCRWLGWFSLELDIVPVSNSKASEDVGVFM